MVVAAAGRVVLGLGSFGDDAVGHQEQARDAGSVLECDAIHLGWRDDALGDEIAVLAGERVESVGALELLDLGHDDGATLAGILGDRSQRDDEGVDQRIDTKHLIADAGSTDFLERWNRADVAGAAAGHHALGDGRASGMERVLDATLLLLEFRLAGGADLDLRHAAGQLGQALLELLAVIVAVGALDLRANLLAAAADGLAAARALDERGVLAGHDDLLGEAQLGQRDLVQVDPQVLHDCGGTREDRDVLQHGLAAVAVARRLDGADIEDASQLVDHQRGERLAGDVLSNDEERLLGLHDLLQEGNQLLEAVDLVLVDEHEALVQFRLHRVGVGDEVGREEPAIELHAFHDIHDRVAALALFHGDDAILADFVKGISHDLANFGVVVGADGGHRADAAIDLGDGLGRGEDLVGHDGDALAHATHDRVGVRARRDEPKAALEDGLGKHGGGRRSVTGVIAGLAGGFLHQLGTDVLDLAGEFDFLGHGHAILGDLRATPRLVQYGVATAGAKRALDGGSEFFDASQEAPARVDIKGEFFHSHGGLRDISEAGVGLRLSEG